MRCSALRRERFEYVVSKVTAMTTVRPSFAAAMESVRSSFHEWAKWEVERTDTNELYWVGM